MLLGYYTTMIPLMCIGTVWPAYQSYKAVASKDAETMARWLQYWLVFAVLTLAGPTIDRSASSSCSSTSSRLAHPLVYRRLAADGWRHGRHEDLQALRISTLSFRWSTRRSSW